MFENSEFKKSIIFINDNLGLILLVPAIMGGAWQIIELSNISVSYIRFFSATQVLSDGLLILFIFSVCWIAIKVIKYSLDNNHPFLTFMVALLHAFSLLLYSGHWRNFDEINFVSRFLLILDSYAIITVIMRTVMPKNWQLKINATPVLLVFLIFIGVPYAMIFFHKNYVYPENLVNLNSLHRNKSEKIAYMSDKYIFIEQNDENNNTKIKIIKLDKLFKPEG